MRRNRVAARSRIRARRVLHRSFRDGNAESKIAGGAAKASGKDCNPANPVAPANVQRKWRRDKHSLSVVVEVTADSAMLARPCVPQPAAAERIHDQRLPFGPCGHTRLPVRNAPRGSRAEV